MKSSAPDDAGLTSTSSDLLERFARAGVEAFHRSSIAEARERTRGASRLQQPLSGPRRDEALDVLDDHWVPGRTYVPPASVADVVYLHGGGWVTGDLDVCDQFCRNLALASTARVHSVRYSLAPEATFPVQFDEALDAVLSVLERQSPGRRTVVCGDSAGGNLAAAATIRLTQQGDDRLGGLALLYPFLGPLDPDAVDPRSELPTLTSADARWFWEQYAAARSAAPPLELAPLLAGIHDLAGLPPTIVISGTADVLYPQALEFAGRLGSAGVAVEHLVYCGVVHGFLWMNRAIPEADDAIEALGSWIREAFCGR